MPANPLSYATAIRTCAECGKSDVAMGVYVQSLRLGVVPNDVSRHVSRAPLGCCVQVRALRLFLVTAAVAAR